MNNSSAGNSNTNISHMFENGVPLTRDEMALAIKNEYVIPQFRDDTLTVDDMLDTVDIELEWYEPSYATFEFFTFIRLVLGEEPENNNPNAHYFFVDCIFQMDNVKPYFQVRNIDYELLKDEISILCTREFSKSTLINYLILYIAAKGKLPNFGTINYGLYVSDSMRGNVKRTMERIAGVYYESDYLKGIFEEVNLTQENVRFVRKPQTAKEIALYNEYVVQRKMHPKEVPGRMKRTLIIDGAGVLTGVRGASGGLFRPEIVFLDDLLANEKDAQSEIVLDTIESTIEADIRGGLSGSKYKMILIGTPYRKNDPVYKRIETKEMLPIVFPRANIVPVEGVKDSEVKSVWPDRHTVNKLRMSAMRAERAAKNGDRYRMRKLMQEHYLRISSDEDRLIPNHYMKNFSKHEYLAMKDTLRFYITTDFTSTGNSGSDLSGIAVWAVNHKREMRLVDLSLRKLELKDQYAKLFEFVDKYTNANGAPEVGIEIDGQQNIHLFALEELMRKNKKFFSFAKQKGAGKGQKGIRSRLENGNKFWRLRAMMPLIQAGKLWIADEVRGTVDGIELIEELVRASYIGLNARYDDGIDLVSQMNMIDIFYPSEPQIEAIKNENNNMNSNNWILYKIRRKKETTQKKSISELYI